MTSIAIAIVVTAVLGWDVGRRHVSRIRQQEYTQLKQLIEERSQDLRAELHQGLERLQDDCLQLAKNLNTTDQAQRQIVQEWNEKFIEVEKGWEDLRKRFDAKFGAALSQLKGSGFHR
jgi:DNA phosphorothioation-dependent restriction protein DptG